MDPITALSTAQTSAKALFDLARGLGAAAVDHQVKARMIQIQEAVLTVQQQLCDAQAERLDLLNQVADLKARLREVDDKRSKLSAYELHEVEPGLLLYRSKPDAGHQQEHFACPKCYSSDVVAVMQQSAWEPGRVRYLCSVCGFAILTGRPSQPQRHTARWVR